MNNDKIIQRIKGLFKEHYFFKKRDLIKHIKVVKSYPDDLIYAALDQIINDKNEFIVDSYGRVGYLVNIGDYYLFQPSEIKDQHISMFDRSRPIDYKRKSLQARYSGRNYKRRNMKVGLRQNKIQRRCYEKAREGRENK